MLEAMIRLAAEAGKIMLEAESAEKEIREKEGSANFVTQYDVAVQRFLQQECAKIMPQAGFLGEEENSCRMKASGPVFIVDPIDGTTNFIHRYRHSAVSIALADKGQVRFGVVCNPYTNEIFSAEKNKGAWRNGRSIQVSQRSLSQALVCFGTSPYAPELAEKSFALAKELFEKAEDIRRSGSAALDLCAVAAGQCELSFELTLQPWDFAAAALIVEEAGGKVSRLDGSPLALLAPNPVLAANELCYEEFLNWREKGKRGNQDE